MNTFKFETILNAHVLTNGSHVLYIEPNLQAHSPETEGQAAVILQTRSNFVLGRIYGHNLLYNIVVWGNLWAVEQVYNALDHVSLPEIMDLVRETSA